MGKVLTCLSVLLAAVGPLGAQERPDDKAGVELFVGDESAAAITLQTGLHIQTHIVQIQIAAHGQSKSNDGKMGKLIKCESYKGRYR